VHGTPKGLAPDIVACVRRVADEGAGCNRGRSRARLENALRVHIDSAALSLVTRSYWTLGQVILEGAVGHRQLAAGGVVDRTAIRRGARKASGPGGRGLVAGERAVLDEGGRASVIIDRPSVPRGFSLGAVAAKGGIGSRQSGAIQVGDSPAEGPI